jgi:hypothetical protein
MRPRLLVLVLVVMTVLPVLSRSDIRNAANPTGVVALAGHTAQGNYCDDGTAGCISGDLRSTRPVGGTPVSAKHSSNSGSTALIIALNLLRWIVGTF